MPAKVIVWPIWMFAKTVIDPTQCCVVNTTSRSRNWTTQLSPFYLGPCKLYGKYEAKNMENAWQYAKVYREHIKSNGWNVDKSYWPWAKAGWSNSKAVRYPMGRGKKPEFSLWDGEHLSYIEARKVIYGPLYAKAVRKTEGWKKLERLYKTQDVIVLLDFDAYDHRAEKMSLTDVLHRPDKKMGHAFVLMMMLTKDKALHQMRF